MAKLIDPGKGLATRELRRNARLVIWKRPAAVKKRDEGTAERKVDWEVKKDGNINPSKSNDS